ncbi:MAG: hypothetical protein K2X81_23105 [Candidatus Obscuribacterales bacterium]|nr:hypothetical protein [Candidatus Obscuribacterales bacterium]
MRFIPAIFKTELLIVQILIATGLAVTGNYYVGAKPNEPMLVSSGGRIDDPKYSDEFKSKRISRLIGHKVNWRQISDHDFGFSSIREIQIEPKNSIRTKPNATKPNKFTKSNKAQHNANNLDNLKINGKNYKWSEIKDVDMTVAPLFEMKMDETYLDPTMAPITGVDRARRQQKSKPSPPD